MTAIGAITTAAAFIGLITLFGAAKVFYEYYVGTVNERTREIGYNQAI